MGMSPCGVILAANSSRLHPNATPNYCRISSAAHGIYSGVSFTLPIGDVLRLAAELRSGGALQRGHIGATTQPVTAELAQAFGLDGAHGALLVRLEPGGPAGQAGLQSGDIVLSVNQRPSASYEAIEAEIAATRPDTVVALDVWRERARRRFMVKIARLATDVPRELTGMRPGSEVRLGLSLNAGKPASRFAPGVYVETASGSGLLAGIEPGDRITALNGMPVVSLADFDSALESLGASDTVALLVTRADVPMYVVIRRDGR
jgi:serine protease Do